jgi:uncharacterized membrane protein
MDGAISNAARVLLAIVPIVGIVMGSVLVFFWMFWAHREKELLIKNNLYEKPQFDFLSFSLLAGLLLAIVGVTLTVFLAFTLGKGYGLLGGLIPLVTGTALLIYYAMQRRR